MAASAFDLRRFAPPDDVAFQLRKHGDHVFRVDADPDVDDVAAMLRIEGAIRGTSDETEHEAAAALAEGKQLLLRFVRERDPDVAEIRIGAQELTVVFALIVHGSTVAEAVMDAITASNIRDRGPDEVEPLAPGEPGIPGAGGDGDGEDGPLASERRSSEQSSGSAAPADGRPVIGTA